MKRWLTAPVLLFLLAAPGCTSDADEVPPAETAGAPAAPADQSAAAPGAVGEIADADIRNFRLDKGVLERWQKVQLAAAQRPDLSIMGDEPLQAEGEQGVSAATASRLLARIEANPEIRSAISDAGMEPRDYVLATAALSNTMYADGMEQAGQPNAAALTNPQNLEFVRANRDAIGRMFAEQGG